MEFILNIERREETAIIDCITGTARETSAATQQAIRMWMTTTAAAVFELLNQRGEDAAHFAPNDPHGFPGWHMIGGTVLGWGLGENVSAIRDWMAATTPWNTLAPVIEPGLDRPMLNGIKFYIAGSEDFETTEVRINGQRHEPSSLALAGMDWPRPQDPDVRPDIYVASPSRQRPDGLTTGGRAHSSRESTGSPDGRPTGQGTSGFAAIRAPTP